MIYFVLILFFSSLIAIVVMLGRKLIVIKNGQQQASIQNTPFEIPYWREIKNSFKKNISKYEHITLILIVKYYIRFSNFTKNKYQETKIKLKNIKNKPNGRLSEKIGNSKILKVVTNYKNKITEITHKIKEEDNNL